MKINSSKKKIKLLVPLFLVLVLVGGAFSYVYAFNGSIFGWTNKSTESNETSTNYDKPTKEQKDAGDEAKKNTVEGEKPNSNNTDRPQSPTNPTASGKSNTDVSFTAASQNGDLLQMRVLISAVENSGSCTLTLTNADRVITKTSEVQAQSNTSTCKGFDVATNELSTGSWAARVVYTSPSSTGSATKNIEIK